MRDPRLGDWSWSDAGMWLECEDDGRVHLLPDFGPKHVMSELCWCHPIFATTGTVMHNVAH